MFSRLLKRHRQQLYTFIANQEDLDLYPRPEPASRFIPEWYKKMPRSRDPVTYEPRRQQCWLAEGGGLIYGQTMKECVPVRDYLTSGYIVPLWCTIKLQLDGDTLTCGWGDHTQQVMTHHPRHQLLGCDLAGGAHRDLGKLISPWHFRTPPGYSSLFFSPVYWRGDIEILPAVVDTDSYHEVNFPFLYHGPDGDTRTIERGTPIIQVMPFLRQDWRSEVECARTDQSWRWVQSYITGAYRRFCHRRKQYR